MFIIAYSYFDTYFDLLFLFSENCMYKISKIKH